MYRVQSVEDYLVAGRKSRGLTTGGSLAATILGGSSTMGLAGLSFAQGFTGSWWLLVGAAGLLALFIFVPAIKVFSVYTLPEMIGRWYGKEVRKIASILIIFAWLGIVGAQANAAGRIMATLLGENALLWTCLAGGVFILYTVTGGQLSVIRTDLIQIILILMGIMGCVFMGLREVDGFAGLLQKLGPEYVSFPLSEKFQLHDLLLLLFIVGSTYLIGPDMLSRIFCSREIKTARRGIILAIAIIVPMAFMISLIGMAAKVLFPQAAPEAAFPLLIGNTLPPVFGALTLLALISAFLSSADTTLLTMSAIISVDILGQKRLRMAGLRLITTICGIASLLVGILSGGIIPSLLLGYTIFSGGLLIPIVAGLAGRVMRRGVAIFCMISGGSLSLLGKLTSQNILIAASFTVSLLALIADQLFRGQKKRPGEYSRN